MPFRPVPGGSLIATKAVSSEQFANSGAEGHCGKMDYQSSNSRSDQSSFWAAISAILEWVCVIASDTLDEVNCLHFRQVSQTGVGVVCYPLLGLLIFSIY